MGRVKGNQQVQYPWAVRAEKLLPPQAVGNIPRQVVRSYALELGKSSVLPRRDTATAWAQSWGGASHWLNPMDLKPQPGAQ